MKKVILLAAVAFGVMSAQAQQAVEVPKLTDNLSVTVKGGLIAPMSGGYDFIDDMRGIFGAEFRKQVTPVYGIGVEGDFSLKTGSLAKYSGTNINHLYVGLFGTANLFNLIDGYKADRKFDVETVVGAGWLHAFVPWYSSGVYDAKGTYGWDKNGLAVKFGLNLNYNLNQQFTVSLKPAINWGVLADAQSAWPAVDKRANFELQAGLTYHIGKKGFNSVKPYDQAEVDALNKQINDLRAQNNACNNNVNALKSQVAKLQAELEECKNAKPVEVVKEVTAEQQLSTVRYVYFRKGSSKIAADQKPNVEMIAAYLKSHPNATVSIKGYASPEGSKEANEKIAAARANAVKTMLIKTYKVKADRIKAEGQGVGNMFEDASWNRVSICTLENAK